MNIISYLYRLKFNITRKIVSDRNAIEFFDNIFTPEDLVKRLNLLNYTWVGEYYLADWNKSINECLSTKELNCGDYMNLFIYLYKIRNIKYTAYYMEDWSNIFDPRYHYISIFEIGSCQYLQSNCLVQNIINIENILEWYKSQGYSIIKKIY